MFVQWKCTFKKTHFVETYSYGRYRYRRIRRTVKVSNSEIQRRIKTVVSDTYALIMLVIFDSEPLISISYEKKNLPSRLKQLLRSHDNSY